MPEFSQDLIRPFGLRVTASGSPLRDLPMEVVASLVRKHKLVLFRGFSEMGRDSFLNYCRDELGASMGKTTLDWDFGPVMEMKEAPSPKNYLFSSERVPYHWDGAFHRVPHYLMFCCVEAPLQGAGGETLFCDTSSIWNDATPAERALWSKIELTYETAKLAHYGGKITGPLVQPYPGDEGETSRILRFAEAVTTTLNPVTMRIDGIEETEKEPFLKNFTARIYDNAYCYRHTWENGDILIADNHALIHGREAFTKDGPRHLRRIQLI